jgi:hypothetical protein
MIVPVDTGACGDKLVSVESDQSARLTTSPDSAWSRDVARWFRTVARSLAIGASGEYLPHHTLHPDRWLPGATLAHVVADFRRTSSFLIGMLLSRLPAPILDQLIKADIP